MVGPSSDGGAYRDQLDKLVKMMGLEDRVLLADECRDMLKYGIPDLRTFFDADLRWLKHYGFVPLDVPSMTGGLTR